MNLNEAKQKVKEYGYRFVFDKEYNEYQVCAYREEDNYYTTDIEDAVNTAKKMRESNVRGQYSMFKA